MKKIAFLFCTYLSLVASYGQTIDVNDLIPKYAAPNYSWFKYKHNNIQYGGVVMSTNDNMFGKAESISYFTYGNRDFNFWTQTGNIIFFPTSGYGGNIGIGTADPSKKLDINNTTIEESFRLTTGTDGRVMTFRGETINFKRAGQNYIAASSSSGSLNFSTGGSDIYNSQIRVRIAANGNVGIGTLSTGSHKLAVEGSIGARKVKVEVSSWSDFVFENSYELKSLEEVEKYILKNRHLPEIPRAKEVKRDGIDLGEMDSKLLQKIEELTLYLIQQNKQNQAQQAEIEQLKKELKAIKEK